MLGRLLNNLGATPAFDAVNAHAIDLVGQELELQFLAHHPSQKPRTECCCQSVSFIIAAMVVPPGDWSSAMTRACFEPVSCGLDGLEAFVCFPVDLGERFFAGF